LPSSDDKAVRGWAYEVKGKAGDKRQDAAARGVQDLYVGGWHYFRGFHKILKSAIDCLEGDGIAQPNIAERAEKSVAMAGENDVACCSRQGRFRNVADGAPQKSVRVALNDDGFQMEPSDFDFANHAAFNEEARGLTETDSFKFRLFVRLIGVGVPDNVPGITEGEDTNCQEKVRRGAKDGGACSPWANCGAAGRFHGATLADCGAS
jgi:hypothetical protein